MPKPKSGAQLVVRATETRRARRKPWLRLRVLRGSVVRQRMSLGFGFSDLGLGIWGLGFSRNVSADPGAVKSISRSPACPVTVYCPRICRKLNPLDGVP